MEMKGITVRKKTVRGGMGGQIKNNMRYILGNLQRKRRGKRRDKIKLRKTTTKNNNRKRIVNTKMKHGNIISKQISNL